MRLCTHGRAEVLGVEPSPAQNCAECDEADRKLRSKELNLITNLRAEIARLRKVIIDIDDFDTGVRSGDAMALLASESSKARIELKPSIKQRL